MIIICLCADAAFTARCPCFVRRPVSPLGETHHYACVRRRRIPVAAVVPTPPLPYAPTDSTPRSMYVPYTTSSNIRTVLSLLVNVRRRRILLRRCRFSVRRCHRGHETMLFSRQWRRRLSFFFSTLTRMTSASYTPRFEYDAPSILYTAYRILRCRFICIVRHRVPVSVFYSPLCFYVSLNVVFITRVIIPLLIIFVFSAFIKFATSGFQHLITFFHSFNVIQLE